MNLILEENKSYMIYPLDEGVLMFKVATRLNYIMYQRRFKAIFDLLPKDIEQKLILLQSEERQEVDATKAKENLISILGKPNIIKKKTAQHDTLDSDIVENEIKQKIKIEADNLVKQSIYLDIADSVTVIENEKETLHPLVVGLENEFFGETYLVKDNGNSVKLSWVDTLREEIGDLPYRLILGATLVFIYASCRYSLNSKSAQTLTWNLETGQPILSGQSTLYTAGSAINTWLTAYRAMKKLAVKQ